MRVAEVIPLRPIHASLGRVTNERAGMMSLVEARLVQAGLQIAATENAKRLMADAQGVRRRLSSINNGALYNAAFVGFINGVYQLICLTNVPVGSYAAVLANAERFAAAVDALIPPTSISSAQAEAMYAVSQSTSSQRYDVGVTGYTLVAEAVVDLYTDLSASLQPAPAPQPTPNAPVPTTRQDTSYRPSETRWNTP